MTRQERFALARDVKKRKREEAEAAALSRQQQEELPVLADPYPEVGTDLEKSLTSCVLQALQQGSGTSTGSTSAANSSILAYANLRAQCEPKAFVQSLFEQGPAYHGPEKQLARESAMDMDEGDSKSEQVDGLIKYIFTPYRGHCSIARHSEVFKVSTQFVERTLLRSACLLQRLSCKLWGNFFQHIGSMLQKGFLGVLFIVNFRFDETPNRIKIPDPQAAKFPNQAEGEGKSTGASQKLAKVLQTEVSVSVLLQAPDGDRKHTLITGYVPTVLQVLDRQTARNMVKALQDSIAIPGLDDCAEKFQHHMYLFSSDEFSANGLTQWGLQALAPGRMQLSTLCDIHKGSTAQSRVFDLCGPAISAVINFALSTAQAGSTGKLQTFLADIIGAKFELKVGTPQVPHDAREHRKSVFDLYLAIPDFFAQETADAVSSKSRLRITQRKQQRAILEHFLNDDIRKDQMIHWAQPGEYDDVDHARRTFLKFVVPALIPCSCPVFPRSRWFGADASLDFIGLLLSTHNLFVPLVERWCSAVIQQPPSAAIEEHDPLEDQGWDFNIDSQEPLPLRNEVQLQSQQPHGAPGDQADEQQQQAPEADEVEQAEPQPHAENAPVSGDAAGNANDGFDWAAYHLRLKTSVADWMRQSVQQKGPSAQCQISLMRQYMAPILKLMTGLLYVSSKRFLREQLAKEARGLEREFRVYKAFKATDALQLLEDVMGMMDSPPVALPEADWRKDISTLAFTMLSRLGCTVYQLFIWRCRKYPYKLCLAGFRLIQTGCFQQSFAFVLESGWGCVRFPIHIQIPRSYVLGLCWLILGSSWGYVGSSWGRLGAMLADLGAKFGAMLAHLGSGWAVEGPPKIPKIFFLPLGIFEVLCWPILGLCWLILGPSWGYVGSSWGHLGAMLAHLGAVLELCWLILGLSLGLCWASWVRVGLLKDLPFQG